MYLSNFLQIQKRGKLGVQKSTDTDGQYFHDFSKKCIVLQVNHTLGANDESVKEPWTHFITLLLDEISWSRKRKFCDNLCRQETVPKMLST